MAETEQEKNQQSAGVQVATKAILQPGESVEKRIEEEIVKFDLPKARIAELKEQFKDLKILPVPAVDASKEEKKAFRESYELVKSAVGVIRPLRTGVEKKRKDLKSDYLIIGKGIDAKAEEYTKLLTEIESPLKTQLEEADKAIEEQKEAEKRAEQDKLNARVERLLDAGIKFDGSFYSIGAISVDVATLKSMPEPAFEALVSKVAETKKLIDEQEAERLREEEEAKAALQKQKEEQEAEAQRLEDEKKKLEDEKAELKKQRTSNRVGALTNLRLSLNEEHGFYIYMESDKNDYVIVGSSDIEDTSSEDWGEILVNVTARSSEIYKAEQDRVNAQIEKDNRFTDRVSIIEKLGMIHFPGIGTTPEQWKFIGELTKQQIGIARADVYLAEPDIWDEWLTKATLTIASVKQDEDAEKLRREEEARKEQERKDRINKRERELISLGWEEVGDGSMVITSAFLNKTIKPGISAAHIAEEDEKIWKGTLASAGRIAVKLIEEENEEKERIKIDAEEKRQARLTDAEKTLEYVKKLNAIQQPEVSEDCVWLPNMQRIKSFFLELESDLNKVITLQK